MQRLRYQLSGQRLRHTPTNRVESATYRLESLIRTETSPLRVLAEGAAQVDALDIETTATAGPSMSDPRRVPTAVTTGAAIGETYVLRSPTGRHELIKVAAIETGTALLTEQPIAGFYPTGSTVRGVTLRTAVIPDEVVSDQHALRTEEPWRIVWELEGGAVHQQIVKLVRHDHGDVDLAAVEADIRRLFPDIASRVERLGDSALGGFVDSSYRQLRARALGRDDELDRYLIGEQGHWAVCWHTLHHLAAMHIGRDGDTMGGDRWLNHCADQFRQFWNELQIGQGGKGVVELEPVHDTAPADRGFKVREIIKTL